MSMNLAIELAQLGVRAEFDNGVIRIDGDEVTESAADQRLAVERAKPRARYPNLDAARTAMAKWIDGIMAKITGEVPEFERANWPAKAAAARAVLAGNASADQTALITGEANERGKTVTEMATVIKAKADNYEAVIARVAGLRGKLDDALEAESDPLKYEAILEGGKTRAAEIATELNAMIS